ncbi:MAG: M20/M25/M40 family metallo-hydrolase [Acidobacteria bacterium]|nr:M20/M25/M40 family metallo-hydrolase [Acidobacteriota bacterium]
MKRPAFLLLASLLLSPAALTAQSPANAALPAPARRVAESLSGERMGAHVRFLASDLLEGRGAGQRGGELAAAYIAAQFGLAGLKPAVPDGSYFQRVPLVGIDTRTTSTLTLVTPQGERPLKYLDEFVATAETQRELQEVDAEIMFVGYGIEAPEYNWDDYKGADIRGKVLLMLVNDPPSDDPRLFGGRALTYYGRWTYKYEKALAKGARGAILIHTPQSAGYGWEVVRNSWGRERPYVRLKPNEPALELASWITEPVARELLAATGHDLAALTSAAARRDFRPVPLPVRVRARLESGMREIETANVVGLVEGSDPKRKDEVVIYTAHYDHLGIGTPVAGDAIYNGAVDNASGMALLLELARAFAEVSEKPPRTLLFIACAAEEGGLRGSEYYATNPIFPPGQTAANINYDGLLVLGRTRDVSLLGIERTTLYSAAERIAHALGLTIKPDANPEQGYYYRSDHFSLAKVGVPATSVDLGQDYVGKPAGWGAAQEQEYREKRYHRPADEYDPSWDFSGLVELAKLGVYLGWEAASVAALPGWKPGDEFEAARKASLKP